MQPRCSRGAAEVQSRCSRGAVEIILHGARSGDCRGAPRLPEIARAQALVQHPDFSWTNPNRLRSVLSAFASSMEHFHAPARADQGAARFSKDTFEVCARSLARCGGGGGGGGRGEGP